MGKVESPIVAACMYVVSLILFLHGLPKPVIHVPGDIVEVGVFEHTDKPRFVLQNSLEHCGALHSCAQWPGLPQL